MKFLKSKLKQALRRLGIDVVTYRPFLELIGDWGITAVLDVGANQGQFAHELRASGYRGFIYSFEPTAKAFASLRQNSAKDEFWHALNFALGRANEDISIHVAEDSQLTSLLKPLRLHSFTGRETIQVKRLDDWVQNQKLDLSTTCLKLDVQGYEYEVLEGAPSSLPSLGAVISELALAKSYDGQPYADELIAFLRDKGFELWTTRRGTWTPNGKREIECDGIFRGPRRA